MNNEIISSIITGSATIISTGVLGVAAVVISDRITKIKEKNRKLLEDWVFLYKIEETLLNEIQTQTGVSAKTKKIESRRIIAERLERPINYSLSNVLKLKK